MTISLWKDHSENAEVSFDLCALKEKYIDDGTKVAQRFVKDANVLAVWLPGPLEISRVSPTSDLHMTILIQSGRDSYYYHQLPHFSEVGRRLEIVFFPIDYLQSIYETGFTGWADVFDLHKLNEIEILYEKDMVLSSLRKRLTGVKPTRLFAGKQIESFRAGTILIERLLNNGKYGDCILGSRKMLMNSMMLLMLTVKNRTFSKLTQLYPELESYLPRSRVEMFKLIQAVTDRIK